MNREQQEMALWREAYQDSNCFLAQERAAEADAAVAEFRKRYPSEPAAPEAVWYDKPPFAKDGVVQPCWMQGEDHPVLVARACDRWEYRTIEGPRWKPLADRRVSHIIKPPEPTT